MKKSYVFAVLAVLLWSTMAPATKYMLGDMPAMLVLAVSSMFATLFLFIVNLFTGKIKRAKEYSGKQYGLMAGLGFMGLFMYSSLYYHGLEVLTSHEACILNYLWPVMIMIFSAVILKEKIDALKVIAMLCAFLGVVVLSWGTPVHSVSAVTGIIACIVAAVFYGLFSVLNKKFDFDQNIAMMVMWGVTSVCAFIYCAIAGNWAPMELKQWLGMIWIGVAADALGYLLWALALKHAGNETSSVSVIAYMTPFLSLVASAVFLKENIGFTAVIALVLIIGGIMLATVRNIVKKKNKGSR